MEHRMFWVAPQMLYFLDQPVSFTLGLLYCPGFQLVYYSRDREDSIALKVLDILIHPILLVLKGVSLSFSKRSLIPDWQMV